MKCKPLPATELLLSALDYDAETGKLTWKRRPPCSFKGSETRSVEWVALVWNKRFAGKPISTFRNKNGYIYTTINCGRYLVHRLIWKLMTGQDPNSEIDHINGVRNDNRWINLREVDCQTNGRNQQLQSRNVSGVVGVLWDPQRLKWSAAIVVDYKTIHLGRYDDLEDAIRARKSADIKYGFHKNHGRKAIPR